MLPDGFRFFGAAGTSDPRLAPDHLRIEIADFPSFMLFGIN